MKRSGVLKIGLVLLVLLPLVPGCRGGGDSGPPRMDGDRVVVTVWHSMQAVLEPAFKSIVDKFNASQDRYEVRAVFQGRYTESLNKLIATDPENRPALIQLDDTATQIMIDSGIVAPAQEFIDEEGYELDDFDKKALDYYRIDERLYSMPFNLAGPILYYDKQDFIEAGLDPEKPPETLDEVREYAEKLVRRDGSGKVTRQGIALTISPWVFEQMLAKQGALYVNNGNGRDARATEAIFDGPEGKRIIEWWDQMVDDGLALNTGQQSLDAMLALGNDGVSMAIESTAALRGAVAFAQIAGQDPKRVGTGPLPAPSSENGGVVLGGASLWIMDERPEEERRGAWEFVKFALEPEQQAQWHSDTGYFPARLSAYDLEVAVKARQDFPQFETAVKQLRASPDNRATQGALVGRFALVRNAVAEAFGQVLSGNAEPGAALESAAGEATGIIEDYNRTAGD